MIPTLKLFFCAAVTAGLMACTSAPVRPALKLSSDSPSTGATAPNVGKVVFIHSLPAWMASKDPAPVNALRDLNMKRATGEGELNLFANGTPVAHLRAFEYVQVEMPYGEYDIQMARPYFVADWKSSARIKVQQPLTHVVIEVGWTSGALAVRSEPVARLDQWHRSYVLRR